MSQGGDGIHHLSRGMTVAENLSMGVNQGNYYVLGGYGKFFLHRGVFLFIGIAHYGSAEVVDLPLHCIYMYGNNLNSAIFAVLYRMYIHASSSLW